jgi:hypothetical protein
MLLLSFLLSGCTKEASVEPEGDNLKDAFVGKNYYGEISIIGGRVNALDHDAINERFVGSISRTDTGLYIQRCNGDIHNNNCVQIRGVPIKTGIVKILVSGGLFGTNVSTGGQFSKTYSIAIKKADDTP